MSDMPRSAQRAYRRWIDGAPESWHWRDRDRFWLFVHVLHGATKQPRSAAWLRGNLRHDCPGLSEDRIEAYCAEYERLCTFMATGEDARQPSAEERAAPEEATADPLMQDYVAWKNAHIR
jgi:hypothetical protein